MIPLLLLAITHMRGLGRQATAAEFRAHALAQSPALKANIDRRARDSNLSRWLDSAAKAVAGAMTFAEADPDLAQRMAPGLLQRFETALVS